MIKAASTTLIVVLSYTPEKPISSLLFSEWKQVLIYGHLKERLSRAIDLYQELTRKEFNHPVILCSGGSSSLRPFSDSSLMKLHLIENGIPSEAIFEESVSLTTLENCVFCYELIRSSALLAKRLSALRDIYVITSDYHLPRACRIFHHYFDEYFLTEAPEISRLPVLFFVGSFSERNDAYQRHLHIEQSADLSAKIKLFESDHRKLIRADAKAERLRRLHQRHYPLEATKAILERIAAQISSPCLLRDIINGNVENIRDVTVDANVLAVAALSSTKLELTEHEDASQMTLFSKPTALPTNPSSAETRRRHFLISEDPLHVLPYGM